MLNIFPPEAYTEDKEEIRRFYEQVCDILNTLQSQIEDLETRVTNLEP